MSSKIYPLYRYIPETKIRNRHIRIIHEGKEPSFYREYHFLLQIEITFDKQRDPNLTIESNEKYEILNPGERFLDFEDLQGLPNCVLAIIKTFNQN